MINVIKLVIVIAVMFMIFGCTSNDPIQPAQSQTMNDMEIPDGFDWNFSQKVEVILIASDSEGNLVEGAEVSLYNNRNNLAFTATTNSAGELRSNIILRESDRSVILKYDNQEISVPVVGNTVYYEMTVEPVRDIRATGIKEVPGGGEVVTVMFEDNWPLKGDYDYNDMVIETRSKLRYASDKLDYVEIYAKVIAAGASYHNGFNIIFESTAFPNTSLGDEITFSAYDSDDNLLPLTSSEVNAAYGTDVIWWTAEGHLQFKFFNDVFDVMAPHGSPALNTNMNVAWVDPITIKIRIDYDRINHPITHTTLNPAIDLDAFNPYITVDGNPGYEIHLQGYFLTGNFDQESLIGTGDDDGTSFSTAEGYSWAMLLYGRLEYPREQVDIVTAYPNLGTYFAGPSAPGYSEEWWYPHPDTDSVTGFIFDREDLTIAEQNAPFE